MKNLFAAFILGIALSGVSLAQTVTKGPIDPERTDRSTSPRIAKTELSRETNTTEFGLVGIAIGEVKEPGKSGMEDPFATQMRESMETMKKAWQAPVQALIDAINALF